MFKYWWWCIALFSCEHVFCHLSLLTRDMDYSKTKLFNKFSYWYYIWLTQYFFTISCPVSNFFSIFQPLSVLLNQVFVVCSSWTKGEHGPWFIMCSAWLYCTFIRHAFHAWWQKTDSREYQQDSWYEQNCTSSSSFTPYPQKRWWWCGCVTWTTACC